MSPEQTSRKVGEDVAVGVKCGVVIVAAGRGERAGGGLPKQFRPLAGKPLFMWSVEFFASLGEVGAIVLVVPGRDGAQDGEWSESAKQALADAELDERVAVVAGGATRQDSVLAGVAALPPGAEIVAVHDAARPFPPANLADAITLAQTNGAAAFGHPATDTVKVVAGGIAQSTPDRNAVWLLQTPQVFNRAILVESLTHCRGSGIAVTDDTSAVEACGHRAAVLTGPSTNIKVTHPEDWIVAEAIAETRTASARNTGGFRLPSGEVAAHDRTAAGAPDSESNPESEIRNPKSERPPAMDLPPFLVGQGFDAHRLVAGRPLVLGGAVVPFELGLEGHSDADAVLHALTDAILGAVGAGDIGQHFPDRDPQWKGADSTVFVESAVRIARDKGYCIGNADMTIMAQRPKLSQHFSAMRGRIAGMLGVSEERVGVKATTTERMGFTGRGEGIAASAVVLLVRVGGEQNRAADCR